MGKFDFQFDEEFTRQLEKLENYDNLAPKILEGAVPVLKRYVVNETDKYHEYSQDYELVNSIKETKPTKNKYGYYVGVHPTGKDGKGVSNMEKMACLEYGYKSKHGKNISPKPILTKAVNAATDEVAERMQEIFNEEVGK